MSGAGNQPDPGQAPAGETQGQAEGSPSGNQPTSDDQGKELRRKITEQGEEIAAYKELFELQQQHPDRPFKDVVSYYQNGNQWPQDDRAAAADQELREVLEQFEDSGPLEKLVSALSRKIELQLQNETAPLRTRQEPRHDPFDGALSDEGVHPFDPTFRQFASETLGGDQVFQTLRKSNPQIAARYAAEKYRSSGVQNGSSSRAHAARGQAQFSGGGLRASSAEEIQSKIKDYDEKQHTIWDMHQMMHGRKS